MLLVHLVFLYYHCSKHPLLLLLLLHFVPPRSPLPPLLHGLHHTAGAAGDVSVSVGVGSSGAGGARPYLERRAENEDVEGSDCEEEAEAQPESGGRRPHQRE